VGKGRSDKRRVTSAETVVGATILLLLLMVAVAVYLKQYDYDAALYGLDPNLLAPKGSGRKVRASKAAGLLVELGRELSLQASEVESFAAENLYEKINGQDQVFFSYGFEALSVIRLGLNKGGKDSFEASIYDMGAAHNAFGIYSTLRSQDAGWQHGQVRGIAAANAIFFFKGRYYVTLVGSSTSEVLKSIIDRAARFLADRLGGDAGQPWAFGVFPNEGLVSESIGYVRANWLGTEFFDKVFTADYEIGQSTLRGYLSRRADAEESNAILQKLRQYWQEAGGKVVYEGQGASAGLIGAEVLGVYEVAFSSGKYVGGVTEADELDSAQRLAQRLLRAVKEYQQ